LVTADRSAAPVAVTLAEGTTAPVSSVTTPRRVTVWAATESENVAHRTAVLLSIFPLE